MAEAKKTRRFGLDSARLVFLGGIVAAIVLAVVANVLVARHYTRWDWTRTKRYSLSPATIATLHDLQEPVDLWVLLGPADPLQQSVKQLLVAYQAETSRLRLHYVDPDRDTAALEDVRTKYKIEAGRTEDGRVVTDAIMIAARGDRHWFILPSDMIEVTSAEDPRAQPREEQAITGAIRNVVGGEKKKLCFTAGHQELALSDASVEGLSYLDDILHKDNYDTATVDTTEPNAHEPFKGCDVVVIAGARQPFTKEETARLRTYLMEGGNLLACVSPLSGQTPTGMTSPNLDPALAPFGIALDEDMLLETDPRMIVPGAYNVRFFAQAKPHPVTAGLVRGEDAATRDAPRILVNFARSMHHVSEPGSAAAVDLLGTSDKAFGLTSIVGASDWTDLPEKRATDLAGPLVIAMAGERPKVAPSAPHGPRAVVIGTGSVIIRQSWMEPLPQRGAAILVLSAISWLAAKPAILDVPAKPSINAGIRFTDETRAQVQRYVLLFMPLAAALLGIAVAFRRRATEGEAHRKPEKPRKSGREKKKPREES